MIRKILNIVINHPYHFYFFLYLTLLIGFYFNENLAGGAMQDFNNYVRILNLFNENYFYNFFNFSELEIDHSPFYFSILKFLNIFIYSDNINFLNFFGSQYYKELGMGGLQLFGHKYILIRFFYLHLSLLSTFLLYLCLREKYKSINKNILFAISSILLITPYFRSYGIWAGDLNLALIFLLLSILFYLKINLNNKSQKNLFFIFTHVLFLALSAYIRPIYSLFSIYFFIAIFLQFNFKKETILFIGFNIFLSLPAFYYLFILDNIFFDLYINFFSNPTINLYSTNILLNISILFFYSMPFIIINIKKFNFSLKAIRINDYIFYSIFILIFFLLLQNFYYDETMKGGGIFYKISVKIFNTYYFFYIISFISFLFIYLVFLEKNFKDILLIIIIVCLDPDPFVYNKTFDPLWFCLILILVESKFFKIFTSGEKIFENLKIIFGFQFIYITIYFTTRYLFAL